MSTTFDIVIDGAPADDFTSQMASLEVEENADLPGAFTLTLPMKLSEQGDYDTPSDPRLKPLANIAVTAKAGDGVTHCLIDGYVLSHRLHLGQGSTDSHLAVWGQDASWLMNTAEQVREWIDVTDAAVAASVFGEYGFIPDPKNTEGDSPAHTESGHSLMQRATDAQFLDDLARRSGKLCRVFCTDTPGVRTGWFAAPSLDGAPALALVLNGADDANIDSVEVSWDVMRPVAIGAEQALFTGEDPAVGDSQDSGLPPLDAQDLATFMGQPMTALLTATVDDGGELTTRAQAVLRDAAWFVKCEGTTDAGRLGGILRVGSVATLNAAGAMHSGKYLVWKVRHSITAEAHKMAFTLVRNAVGAPAAAGGLGL